MPPGLGWAQWNMVETIGAFIMAAGVLIAVVNFARSLHGPVAGRDPWYAGTLEWETESPPAVYGSEVVPLIVTRLPLWDGFDEHVDPDSRTLDETRAAAMTTPKTARLASSRPSWRTRTKSLPSCWRRTSAQKKPMGNSERTLGSPRYARPGGGLRQSLDQARRSPRPADATLAGRVPSR